MDKNIKLLLAIFIPPAAIYFHNGIGSTFWINLVLTFLGGLPGIIHALYVVLQTPETRA